MLADLEKEAEIETDEAISFQNIDQQGGRKIKRQKVVIIRLIIHL